MSAVTALARISQVQGMCTSLQTLEHSSQIPVGIDLRLSHSSPMMMKSQRFHSVREEDVW